MTLLLCSCVATQEALADLGRMVAAKEGTESLNGLQRIAGWDHTESQNGWWKLEGKTYDGKTREGKRLLRQTVCQNLKCGDTLGAC